MRFVPVKNEAQLDVQALHRVRDRWMGRKTAVINQLRGFLLEHGITVAAGPAHLKRQIPSILEDAENLLSPRMRMLLLELGEGEPDLSWRGLTDVPSASKCHGSICSI
jgi:transposase